MQNYLREKQHIEKRQSKAILPSISSWADTSTGLTQDTYANLAQDYMLEPLVEDDIRLFMDTNIADTKQDTNLSPVPAAQKTPVSLSSPTPIATARSST